MKNYNQLKNQTYKRYKSIGKIYCPYLKRKVAFNSKGFWHIIYRSRKTKRDLKSQILRFKLLPKAAKVIKLSHTLQEYQKLRKNDKKVEYFAFIAIIADWKIKVIVKKIGKGRPFFWSIIPNWVTSRKRNGKRYLLHKGDLEKD